MMHSPKKSKIYNVDSYSSIGIEKEDILFFHYSGATDCLLEIEKIKCKKVLVFQNVSNPELYRKTDWKVYTTLAVGVEEARHTHLIFDRAITLSGYSKQNLVEYGWEEEKIDVVPIIPLPESNIEVDECIINKFNDETINFLHIGRVAPNKKIEDIVHIFEYYQKNIESNTRLLLVGDIQFNNYYDALQKYIDEHNINNVEITGSISQEEVEAYYRVADLYLCMSEHEGFCLPIIESFQRKVPVVAYNSTAVPYTMGGAGVLVETKEPSEVSAYIRQLLEDDEYRERIIDAQYNRASNFQINAYTNTLERLLKQVTIPVDRRDFSQRFQDDIKLKRINCEGHNLFEGECIIYGYGKAGRKLYGELSEKEKKKIKAICDNGETKNENVIKHNECINKYTDCNYIVTMQKGYISVIQKLLVDGIKAEKIYFYDCSKNQISQ